MVGWTVTKIMKPVKRFWMIYYRDVSQKLYRVIKLLVEDLQPHESESVSEE